MGRPEVPSQEDFFRFLSEFRRSAFWCLSCFPFQFPVLDFFFSWAIIKFFGVSPQIRIANITIKFYKESRYYEKNIFQIDIFKEKSIDMFKEICIFVKVREYRNKKSHYKSREWYEVWSYNTNSLQKTKY